MGSNCGTCKFWRRRSDHTKEIGGGYCVRFPPFAPSGSRVWADAQGWYLGPSAGHLNDTWPNTSEQSWCGEYSAALTKDTPHADR